MIVDVHSHLFIACSQEPKCLTKPTLSLKNRNSNRGSLASAPQRLQEDWHQEGRGSWQVVPAHHLGRALPRHRRPGDQSLTAQHGGRCYSAPQGPSSIDRKASPQKQTSRFSSSKPLASSGFIKFPFRLLEKSKENK